MPKVSATQSIDLPAAAFEKKPALVRAGLAAGVHVDSQDADGRTGSDRVQCVGGLERWTIENERDIAGLVGVAARSGPS